MSRSQVAGCAYPCFIPRIEQMETTMNTVLSRRRFVQGLGLGFGYGGVALACGLPASRVRAEQLAKQYTLTGNAIDLAIGATPHTFISRARPPVHVNRSLPAAM